MTNDALLGNVIGAGVTLMVADRIFRPKRYLRKKRLRKNAMFKI